MAGCDDKITLSFYYIAGTPLELLKLVMQTFFKRKAAEYSYISKD